MIESAPLAATVRPGFTISLWYDFPLMSMADRREKDLFCKKTNRKRESHADPGTEEALHSMLDHLFLTPEQRQLQDYDAFLRSKLELAKKDGFFVTADEVRPLLKPHQKDIVRWAVSLGRAAIFAAFGLGKTLMQLEIARLITEREDGRFLIVAPLGVRQEFQHVRAGYHGSRKPRPSLESTGAIRSCMSCGQLLVPARDVTNPFAKIWPRNCPRCCRLEGE